MRTPASLDEFLCFLYLEIHWRLAVCVVMRAMITA